MSLINIKKVLLLQIQFIIALKVNIIIDKSLINKVKLY